MSRFSLGRYKRGIGICHGMVRYWWNRFGPSFAAEIRPMIKVIDPQIGETIYDGAVGSAGFLCEAYGYLLPKAQTAADYENLARVQVKAKVTCAEAERSRLPVSPDLSSRGVVLPPS